MPKKQISITMTDIEQKSIIEIVDNLLESMDDELAYPKFIDQLCNEINNLLDYTYHNYVSESDRED